MVFLGLLLLTGLYKVITLQVPWAMHPILSGVERRTHMDLIGRSYTRAMNWRMLAEGKMTHKDAMNVDIYYNMPDAWPRYAR